MKHNAYALIFLLLPLRSHCQQDSYKFPVTNRSAEWGNLKTYAQKREACQVPKAILESMSTPGLVKTCLDYPLLTDILLFKDMQTGVNEVKRHFDGIDELILRRDAIVSLLEKHRELQKIKIDKSWEPIAIGVHVFKLIAVEVLTAQTSILEKLESSDRKELLKYLRQVYSQKKADVEYHGYSGINSNVWIMARLLDMDAYPQLKQLSERDKSVKSFIDYGAYSLDYNKLDEIVQSVDSYLN